MPQRKEASHAGAPADSADGSAACTFDSRNCSPSQIHNACRNTCLREVCALPQPDNNRGIPAAGAAGPSACFPASRVPCSSSRMRCASSSVSTGSSAIVFSFPFLPCSQPSGCEPTALPCRTGSDNLEDLSRVRRWIPGSSACWSVLKQLLKA